MKGFAVLTLAVVAGLLVGCTDQTSIIEPAAPQASMNVPAPPPPSHGVWTVDKMVYAVETATTYHIYGEIYWTMRDNGGEYAFTTDVKAEVSIVAEGGAMVTVADQTVNKGEVSKSGNVLVVNEYATGGLQSSSALRLTYTLGERVRLAEVSIVFRPWDSRKAPLAK